MYTFRQLEIPLYTEARIALEAFVHSKVVAQLNLATNVEVGAVEKLAYIVPKLRL
jgi:hypothetical protein